MRRRKQRSKQEGKSSEKSLNFSQKVNRVIKSYDSYAISIAPWRIDGIDTISSGLGGFMTISLYIFVGLYLANKLHEMAFFSNPIVNQVSV